MKKVVLKLCLQSWDEMKLGTFTIQDFYAIFPHKAIKTEWLGQAITDPIWLTYWFESEEDKQGFLESLPALIRGRAFDD